MIKDSKYKAVLRSAPIHPYMMNQYRIDVLTSWPPAFMQDHNWSCINAGSFARGSFARGSFARGGGKTGKIIKKK